MTVFCIVFPNTAAYGHSSLCDTLKKICYLLAWLLPAAAFGQCPTGDVSLTSQAGINAFPGTYPGCTTIAGALNIAGNDIVDLSPLGSVTHVTGAVSVLNCTVLGSLSGLHLTQTGGLTIHDNPALTSLAGLESLQSVTGDVDFEDNDVLTGTSALTIASIGGTLYISFNGELTDLSGFSNITALNGDLVLISNRKLPTASGLHNITSVGGDVVIEFQEIFTSMTGLEALTTIDGELSIYSNEQLADLSAFNNLTSVTGGIEIDGCPALTDIPGFNGIVGTHSALDIRNNQNLTDISGFQGITSIDGQTVTPDLKIIGNPILASVTGFGNLTNVTGSVSMSDNDVLTDLSGLSSLQKAGQVSLYYNGLTQLNDFASLEEIGFLDVQRNASLVSLGLPKLASVASLNVSFNPVLPGLDLPALETIQGALHVSDNKVLTTLAGLSKLKSLNDVTITFNPQLSFCAISPVCTLIDKPHASEYAIYLNGSYCGSEAEVLAHCAALPVTLVSFDAKNVEGKVWVQWVTASEENSSTFEIQRLANDGKWKTIGHVAARGTSYEAARYQFTDAAPISGNNLYRLKMIDIDGTFTYSQIKNVRIAGQTLTGIYPNPVTDKLYLSDPAFGGAKQIRIYDLSGKMIMQKPLGPQQGARVLDTGHLPSGTYIIHSDQPGQPNVRFVKK